MSDLCSFSYLCLISGILMQLAAATAAKGTNRPIRGETCCKTHIEEKKRKKKQKKKKKKKNNYIIIFFSKGHIKMLHVLMIDQTYFL